MKRQKEPTDAVVYRYGARPDRLDEWAEHQLRLATRLWNDLVWIDRRYEASVEDCYRTDSLVAAATLSVADADASYTAAVDTAQRSKMAARDAQSAPDAAAEVVAARAALKAAWAELKAAKRAAKPAVQPLLDEMAFARRLQIEGDKAARDAWRAETGQKRGSPEELGSPLYRRYMTEGLYHGTYSDVIQRYDVARRRIAKDRAAWRPGDAWPRLRTKPFDGSGTLAVPLMAQRGKPQDTAAVMAGRWAGVVEIGDPLRSCGPIAPSGRRGATRETRPVSLTTGQGRPRITMDVIFHRPLPPGWNVKLVRATREVTAGRGRWTVQFTLVRPAEPRRTGPRRAAVNVGWRSLGGGRYRAGAVAANFSLPDPPEHLAGWVDGAQITVPAAVAGAFRKADELRGLRDDLLNGALTVASGWLGAHPDRAAELGATAGDVARWRSPGRLASLVGRWRANGVAPSERAVWEQLEGWRKSDRHLWSWEANSRAQAIARRDDGYRKVAAWLHSTADEVIVGAMDIAGLARRPDGITDRAWTEQQEAASAARFAVAPSRLRHALEVCRGGASVRVDDRAATRVHHACGTDMVAAGEDPAASIVMLCPQCGPIDQDISHAEALLLRVPAAG